MPNSLNRFLLLVGFCTSLCGAAAHAAKASAPAISSTTIGAIAFSGNRSFGGDQLAAQLSIRPDQVFNPDQVGFSAEKLAAFYRDTGFADVAVSSETRTMAPLRILIHFDVTEGPVYHVGKISVSGNRLISAKIIRRDLGVNPGDPFSQAKVYEGNKELFLTSYFETIDIHYSTAAAHLMNIRVAVKERSTRFVKGGGGYGTETKERISLGYEDLNFLGNERHLNLTATQSGFLTHPQKYRTTILNMGVTQPHLFDSRYYTGATNLSQEWDDREAYNDASTAWISSIGRRFGRSITAEMRYRFQGTRLTRINPEDAGTITTANFTNISALGPQFTYDNTNDPFLPSQGWRFAGRAEQGITLIIGDVRFKKFTAKAGRFETFFHEWTVFGGLQYGIVRPDSSGDSIPIFERFTLGGANTVRGYEEQELGPRDAQGAPLGGNEFAVGNLELRHRLYKKLFGVTFLDGGQLWQQPAGKAWPTIHAKGIGDFAYGTGLGIRLHTPVGAVRLEAGYKLNPPPGDYTFFQRSTLHFSLGEVF